VGKASKLILGTAQFTGRYGITNEPRDFRISDAMTQVRLATANGMTTFDTAKIYGDAECFIEESLTSLGFNSIQVSVATKISLNHIENFEDSIQEIEESRNNLGALLKIIFIHDWDMLPKSKRKLIKLLVEAYQDIRFGVSIYESIRQDIPLLKLLGISVIQIPLSLLNQSHLSSLNDFHAEGFEVWARSIFLQGALDTSSPRNPFKSHPDVLKISKFCSDSNFSALQLGLDFLKDKQVRPILGVSNEAQLKELIDFWIEDPLGLDYSRYASLDSYLCDPRVWK